MDPIALTISEARDLIAAGRLSISDLTSACSEQIRLLNPQLNAFISIVAAPDLPARKAEEDSLTHPLTNHLLGIPLAIKDLIDVAGLPTTAGSRFFGEAVTEDAFVIDRLKQAGVVLMGKTNLHEIALGVTNNNPHFGPCRNPWDTARIPGGSSGGSAVAVASGMALGALGTDTGGSIRIPAALCGTVGLKPTLGRLSTRGVLPLSWNLDHVGPITKSVRDAALLLQVMAKYDPRDPGCISIMMGEYLGHLQDEIKDRKFALATGEYFEGCDAQVMRAVREAAGVFESLGAQVVEVEVPGLREAAQANGLMTQADAAAFHKERLQAHADWFGEDVRSRLEQGAACGAGDYALARQTQAEARRKLELFFETYDVLLLPTTPVAASLIEGADALEQARRLTRYTAPFNLTGLPALSVPCGFTVEGLPIGMQIVSRHWGEVRVLRAGHAYEQATNWRVRRPPIMA